MTSPSAMPPHQDPTPHNDLNRVTMMEYVTTLISTLDRRFDSLHQDLKDSITDRFFAVERRFGDTDLRYQQRFDAQTQALNAALAAAKEAVATAMIAAEKAVAKAEAASEKRFESQNEFRGQLSDQTKTFVSRAEFDAVRDASQAKLNDLASRIDKSEGKSVGLNSGWAYLISAVSLIGAAITIVTIIATR